jgi:hypothetical protein
MRAVRFDDYICLRTYHDGYKQLEPLMLYDLADDPHEQHNLASARPEMANRAMRLLEEWYRDAMLRSTHGVDPMMTVLREGGALHTRGQLPNYLKRLRDTGRAHHADRLAALHPNEV